jgi:hypothetical protein
VQLHKCHRARLMQGAPGTKGHCNGAPIWRTALSHEQNDDNLADCETAVGTGCAVLLLPVCASQDGHGVGLVKSPVGQRGCENIPELTDDSAKAKGQSSFATTRSHPLLEKRPFLQEEERTRASGRTTGPLGFLPFLHSGFWLRCYLASPVKLHPRRQDSS